MNKQTDWTGIISKTTGWLVVTITTLAFILSYNALWSTALTYGLPGYLAWIWPLLIDFPLIVFSFAVVRANLMGESTKWPWSLVGVFTLATVAMNLLHLENNVIKTYFTETTIAQFVAVIAPLALFLSFETLMGMIKSSVKRDQIQQAVNKLAEQVNELTIELGNLEIKRTALVVEISQLQTNVETAKAESEHHKAAKVSKETFSRAVDVVREHYQNTKRVMTATELAQAINVSKTSGGNIVSVIGPMFTNSNGHNGSVAK